MPDLPSPSSPSNGHPGSGSGPTPSQPKSGSGLLIPFLGAFCGILVLGGIGAAIYFGAGSLPSSTSTDKGAAKPRDLVHNVAAWQPGTAAAQRIPATGTPDKADIGWWTKTFNLPKPDEVMAYLKNQGLNVVGIEPIHYAETKDNVTITYQVHAEVPSELLRLQAIQWHPTDPLLARYAPLLVLNQGLPAGMMWDTQNPMIAASVGEKLNFTWQVHVDKAYKTVTTDRLPYEGEVFSPQQVSQFQNESGSAIAALQADLQQIHDQVQQDLKARLAQIPSDPPKPKTISSKWGGDGSGEPTKSAARIGGGAAGGAAGGALFGSIAGNAGMGAGIGAGVGLISGIIYDQVSKDNDKKEYQRAVAAQNENNLEEWKIQIKDLHQQRAKANADAEAQNKQELNQLGARLIAAKGEIGNLNSAPPSSDQPSGPTPSSNQ